MSQADEIAKILKYRKDYYKVLGVERNASADEIKRAYKKKAVFIHPDKCSLPGASEAFQVINTAQTTLLDPQKRAVFDRGGAEGVQQHESGGGGGGFPRRNPYYQQRGGHQQQFQHPFEEFFYHFQRPQRRPGAGGDEPQFQEVNLNMFMLLPVLLFILLAMLLQSSVSDAGFSSSQSSMFGSHRSKQQQSFQNAFSLAPKYDEQMTIKRTTQHPHYPEFSVDYYVSRQWNDYAKRGYIDVRKTELEVLRRHRDSMGRKCESESLRMRAKDRSSGKQNSDICRQYEELRERVRG